MVELCSINSTIKVLYQFPSYHSADWWCIHMIDYWIIKLTLCLHDGGVICLLISGVRIVAAVMRIFRSEPAGKMKLLRWQLSIFFWLKGMIGMSQEWQTATSSKFIWKSWRDVFSPVYSLEWLLWKRILRNISISSFFDFFFLLSVLYNYDLTVKETCSRDGFFFIWEINFGFLSLHFSFSDCYWRIILSSIFLLSYVIGRIWYIISYVFAWVKTPF